MSAYKQNLETTLINAIKYQDLPEEERNKFSPLVTVEDINHANLSVFLHDSGAKAFKASSYDRSGSFKILDRYPIDLDNADQELIDAVKLWWEKYRCMLVDYWNECNPTDQIDHPYGWNCAND